MVTLFQQTPSTGALVEATAPDWAQRMVMKLTQFFQPTYPIQPNRVWYCNKADLPPAANWPGCIVIVPDQSALVISEGGSWLRINTAGPI